MVEIGDVLATCLNFNFMLLLITQKCVSAAAACKFCICFIALPGLLQIYKKMGLWRGALSTSVGSVSYLSLRKPLLPTSSLYRKRVWVRMQLRCCKKHSRVEILLVCFLQIKTKSGVVVTHLSGLFLLHGLVSTNKTAEASLGAIKVRTHERFHSYEGKRQVELCSCQKQKRKLKCSFRMVSSSRV